MRDAAIQACVHVLLAFGMARLIFRFRGLVAAAFAGDRDWRDRLHIITYVSWILS